MRSPASPPGEVLWWSRAKGVTGSVRLWKLFTTSEVGQRSGLRQVLHRSRAKDVTGSEVGQCLCEVGSRRSSSSHARKDHGQKKFFGSHALPSLEVSGRTPTPVTPRGSWRSLTQKVSPGSPSLTRTFVGEAGDLPSRKLFFRTPPTSDQVTSDKIFFRTHPPPTG